MDATTKPDAYGELIEPTTLKIQRLLPGPIERIWAYLTDSDLRRKWLAAGAMEMKVGAPVELVWRNDELNDPPSKRPEGFSEEHRMQSRITELEPLRKLSIAWNGQRRRHVRAGAQRQGRAAHRDPSPSARSLDHAQGRRRLAHASRCSGRPRQRRGAGVVLGRLEPACTGNTTSGCRPEAARRNHATSIATNRS